MKRYDIKPVGDGYIDIDEDVNGEWVKYEDARVEHIIHCEKCGASWYDDGWTPSCPKCRITKLEARVERVDKIVSRLECLPQSTIYSRGIAYEFRTALDQEE